MVISWPTTSWLSLHHIHSLVLDPTIYRRSTTMLLSPMICHHSIRTTKTHVSWIISLLLLSLVDHISRWWWSIHWLHFMVSSWTSSTSLVGRWMAGNHIIVTINKIIGWHAMIWLLVHLHTWGRMTHYMPLAVHCMSLHVHLLGWHLLLLHVKVWVTSIINLIVALL